MGTKFASVYATVIIGHLEQKLYFQAEEKFRNNGKYFEKHCNRFLDDCFIPWNKSLNDLHTFQRMLNNLRTDIKFTIEYSSTEQPFFWVF